MLKNAVFASLVIVASFVLDSQNFAAGNDVDFCSGSNSCPTTHNGVFCNNSLATVKRVKIHQENEHGCVSDKREHDASLQYNDHFDFIINAKCSYNFSVETTSGCTGQKSIKITLSNNKNGKTVVMINNACGSLNMNLENLSNYKEC